MTLHTLFGDEHILCFRDREKKEKIFSLKLENKSMFENCEPSSLI